MHTTRFLSAKLVMKVALAAAFTAAAMSPGFAARRHAHRYRHHVVKVINACAKPTLRCISDCDAYHWCRVYACSNNQTMVAPLRCKEDTGLCFAPHC